MGVPAFFRWLSRKYPSVIVDCVENRTNDDEGNPIPEDTSQPNPNGVEFDNLYLDMNGIIHPCTHPEDKPAPKNEDEMMVAIFECIDRLFAIVRPRKVLYMAIDGVAPRAKMNQQRSRRFRASKETAEKILEMARIREQLEAAGAKLPPVKEKGEHFDSNCITPGTPFMEKLSRCLHYYIHDRLNSDPGWKDIKVILSDANVPGEGEHKIMDYIRKQRAQPDHDPNTQHVLCGADADLIMLGLATHEPNFTIIREEFLPNKPRPCEMCGQIGHEMAKCQGLNEAISDADAPPPAAEVRFIFVRLFVLREYLFRTLAMPNLPFKYDFDRAIDDWVFMCFFVGNDFLPHLPSLEIRENAIDRLIELYKKCVYKTMGWLTDSGEVNLDRVQMILSDLGMAEDQIFKERQRKEVMFKEREKAKKRRTQGPSFNEIMNTPWAPQAVGRGGAPQAIQNARIEAARIRMAGGTPNTNPLEALLKPVDSDEQKKGVKRKIDDGATEEKQDDEAEDYQKNDEVRLWEDGFKDRYYESKFDVPADNQNFRYSVALQYVRGLCWVLKYYYQGCASWKWYFPYHYAPFASDFINIVGLSTEFEKNTIPFKPLEQLMGVFPAASCSHVPEPWGILMSSPTSPIIDFYPTDFKIDLNGKKFAWQGVALLPFVDERRLFKALKPYYKYLTPAEIARNIRGDDRLYVGPQNRGYKFISALYNEHEKTSEEEFAVLIDGMQGTVLLAVDCVPVDGRLDCPINGLRDIDVNNVLSVRYRDPKYADTFVFPAKWLPGAIEPPKTLGPEEDRPNNYRPVVGFNRNHVGQASLGGAGHRMMDFSMRGGGGQGGRGGGYGGQSNSGGGMRNYNSNSSYNDNRQGGGSDWSQNRNRNYGSSGGYQQNQQHYQGGGGGGGNGGGGRGGGYNSQYSNNQGGNNNWQQRNNYGQQPYQQRNNRGGGGNSRGGGGGAYQRGGSQQQGFWK